MEKIKEFGATRISMLLLVLNACGLSWFALIFYPDSVFTPIFALVSNITSGVVGFFIAKSTQDSGKPSVQPVEKEIATIDPTMV